MQLPKGSLICSFILGLDLSGSAQLSPQSIFTPPAAAKTPPALPRSATPAEGVPTIDPVPAPLGSPELQPPPAAPVAPLGSAHSISFEVKVGRAGPSTDMK